MQNIARLRLATLQIKTTMVPTDAPIAIDRSSTIDSRHGYRQPDMTSRRRKRENFKQPFRHLETHVNTNNRVLFVPINTQIRFKMYESYKANVRMAQPHFKFMSYW